MSTCNRKFIWEQFDWSLTTNFNPSTWYFNPRTPNPRTFQANPRTETAHFVLGLMKFYGTPLGHNGLTEFTCKNLGRISFHMSKQSNHVGQKLFGRSANFAVASLV